MKKFLALPFLIMLYGIAFSAQEQSLTKDEIVRKIFEAAKKNDRISETYGFYEENLVKKLNEDGKIKKQEKRTYRTVWIEDTAYAELVAIDGKPLTTKQKSEEDEKKKKFVKRLHDKKDKDEDDIEITWEDLAQKYSFDLLPSGAESAYVFSFTPKQGSQKERNRIEKIFNHLTGKFWADKDFNLIKAEARLSDSIRFGWGLIARIDQLEMEYSQQPFEKIWLPSSLHIKFEAKLALVKTERQEIDSRFYDPYLKPGSQPPASGNR